MEPTNPNAHTYSTQAAKRCFTLTLELTLLKDLLGWHKTFEGHVCVKHVCAKLSLHTPVGQVCTTLLIDTLGKGANLESFQVRESQSSIQVTL